MLARMANTHRGKVLLMTRGVLEWIHDVKLAWTYQVTSTGSRSHATVGGTYSEDDITVIMANMIGGG